MLYNNIQSTIFLNEALEIDICHKFMYGIIGLDAVIGDTSMLIYEYYRKTVNILLMYKKTTK